MKHLFLSIFSALVFISTGLSAAHAQQSGEQDISSIIKETQKLDSANDSINIIWWIPNEYWQRALGNSHRLTATQVTDFTKTLEDYTVVLVIDAKKGAVATLTYTPEDIVRKNTKLILPSGDQLSPLADDDLTPAAKNIFSMMKPILGNMMGQLGQNADFLFFRNKDKDGKLLLNPIGTGKLTVNSNGHSASWRLPLGSLLPPKICPVCGEPLPGNYMFCPFDGTKLK